MLQRTRHPLNLLVAGLILAAPAADAASASPRFRISYPASTHDGPHDGRMIVIIAAGGGREPGFQVNRRKTTAQIFGADVERWPPECALPG